MFLTIGMPTYQDYHGVYFTLQALSLYHDLTDTELLVVDNYGTPETQALTKQIPKARYVKEVTHTGTAPTKNAVFAHAKGDYVLCCDSHVLFPPNTIQRLKEHYRQHPDTKDLYQGPLLYDNGNHISTHLKDEWGSQMWGKWATDPRGTDPDHPPFEIPAQGMGVFSCKRDAWLGFNPKFRGFGGEEGYMHHKYKQAGRKVWCLPFLRWMHRFNRPEGPPFPLRWEDKYTNYITGFTELGLDTTPITKHFAQYIPKDQLLSLHHHILTIQP